MPGDGYTTLGPWRALMRIIEYAGARAPSRARGAKKSGSRSHGQHHAKPRSPADHLVVAIGGLSQWVALDHGADPGQGAELQRVLGVLGGTGGPALDGAPRHDDLQRADGERFRRGSDDHQLATRRQAVDQSGDGFGIGGGRQDHARASELLDGFGRSARAG